MGIPTSSPIARKIFFIPSLVFLVMAGLWISTVSANPLRPSPVAEPAQAATRSPAPLSIPVSATGPTPPMTRPTPTPPRTEVLLVYSQKAYDGWIRESSETSGKGGAMYADSSIFRLGDDALNRQYRAILSFDTSTLPNKARIAAAWIIIEKAGLVGTDPFRTHGRILGDIREGSFSNNRALQIQDFEAPASKNLAVFFWDSPDGVYSGNINAMDWVYINKNGLTQFRLRFRLDDNNDLGADYLKLYSGDLAPDYQQPVLVIHYYPR